MFYVIRKTPKGTWIQESTKLKNLKNAELMQDAVQRLHPEHKVFIVAMVEDM